MSTTTDVNVHFELMMQAVHDAHRDVIDVMRNENSWTAAAKEGMKDKIKVVRADLIHASDCAICTGWE